MNPTPSASLYSVVSVMIKQIHTLCLSLLCCQCHDQTDEPHTLCLSPLCSSSSSAFPSCIPSTRKILPRGASNPWLCSSRTASPTHCQWAIPAPPTLFSVSWSNRWTPHPLPLSTLLSVSWCHDQTDEPHTLYLSPFCCQYHVMITQMNPTPCASLHSVLSVMIKQMNPTPCASLHSVLSVMSWSNRWTPHPVPVSTLLSVSCHDHTDEPHNLCLSPFCCVMISWSNRWTPHPLPLSILLSVSCHDQTDEPHTLCLSPFCCQCHVMITQMNPTPSASLHSVVSVMSWSHRWTPHPVPLSILLSVSCHDHTDEPHTLCLSPLCCQCHVMITQMNPTPSASLHFVVSVMITQTNPTPSASLHSVLLLLLRSQAISQGFNILGKIFAYVTVFNPTIEVVTFCLHGWCMLDVFLLQAFTHLGHECQDLLGPCDWMHVCTD